MLKQLFLKLRKKIFVKLVMLIIIPNVLFVLIISQLTNYQIEQNLREIDATLGMIGHATSREIQALFKDVTTMSNHIVIDTEIQRILSGNKAGDAAPWKKRTDTDQKEMDPYVKYDMMGAVLSRYRMIWKDVYSIAVVSQDGDIYVTSATSSGPSYQINSVDLSRSFLFKEVSSPEQSGMAWRVNDALTKNPDMITMARKIYGMYNSRQVIGYVIINLSLDAVRSSFEVYNYYEDMIFGMINQQQTTWMTYENKQIVGGEGRSLPVTFTPLPDRFVPLNWYGRTWRTEVTKMDTGDYLIVGLDSDYIERKSLEFRNQLYLGFTFFLILACFISLRGTKLISERLRKLNRAIKSFGQKKWGTRIELKGNDEINDIANTFNSMAIEIEELLDDVKKQQQLKRTFELRVLEYQINPHFLYNTLDSINWLALDSGQKQISQMVNGLSKLFRLILSKGKEMITLEEEFEMTSIYLDIQKIRFGKRFEYDLILEPEIASYPIAKLILQPIVENAIVHGVRRLRSPGKIVLTGRRIGDSVILEISDNGVGMSPEKLKRQVDLLNADVLENEMIPHSGYGMKNVDSRLKLLYAKEYKMLIQSSQEQPSGTSIQIQIKQDAMLRNLGHEKE
ncbi:sensor histidine kinase [Ammoniphilus sp. 3BR4]|uniref:sensor histidine kinase n=1 Tax=Ammoniphilus sp. 3BR4 TaxID=3158265 RepID=UPI003465BB57